MPVWFAPTGWYQYMNFQITPEATDEIAIGMKISDLTTVSYWIRSNSTAMVSPKVSTRIM